MLQWRIGHWEEAAEAILWDMIGDLEVVERWLTAVNDEDVVQLELLSREQIEIVGPRGRVLMPRRVLGEWLARSGFRAQPLRWFCGGDGRVVVEHVGQWHDVTTGDLQADRIVGSEFFVFEGQVTRYVRHDAGVAAALSAADLDEQQSAVTARK